MVTIFTCESSFEAMMTCIYAAWASRLGHRNLRLALEPVEQQELFCDYIHVEPDSEKASRVVQSIQRKISWEAFQWVYQAAMNDEEGRLDSIYRFLLLGFHYGRQITNMLGEAHVMEILRLQRKTGNEAGFFREIARFSCIGGKVYVSHLEPKCNVLDQVARHFVDRMPSEYWIMIDDNRKLAAVHPKDEDFYLTILSEEEFVRLKITETQEDDEFVLLWKEFFRTIGVEERENERCQRTHLPLWTRRHMTEFRHAETAHNQTIQNREYKSPFDTGNQPVNH